MSVKTCAANLAWRAANAPGYRSFCRALERPAQSQAELLRAYLRTNQDTHFGRKHGFAALRSVRDYQQQVPLSTYDDYEPYIELIARGESAVLTRERVKLFEPSSGSTAAAKWIPYTATLQAEFRRAIAPWVFGLYREQAYSENDGHQPVSGTFQG